MTQSVRLKLIQNVQKRVDNYTEFRNDPKLWEKVKPNFANLKQYGLRTREDVLTATKQIEQASRRIVSDAVAAKVIVFPSGQAEIFISALDRVNFQLDYLLPFPVTLLQFSKPVLVPLADQYAHGELIEKEVGALLLSQGITKDETFNLAFLIEKDLDAFRTFSWESTSGELTSHVDGDGEFNIKDKVSLTAVKNLAIACIGYINCENVYLHPVESVAERINAKRERKGKSRIEPYYVCRIRGVEYDSAGNPTGEGAKHGIRYDVRGHFRRLTTGKTTWVVPHQRGLKNELYVPKTYVVDRVTA